MLTGADEQQWNSRIQNLQEALRLGLAVVTELWSFSTKDWVSSVHAADIDGDGDIEVLVGSRNYHLYVLTKFGDLKREVPFSSDWVGTVVGIDGTGVLDATRVVAGSRDNTVYAFDETWQVLWKYTAGLVIRQIVVCDINQDGKMEVIVGSEDRCIHVLACESGALLWKYPTNAWVRAIYAADVDNDGAIEILGGSGDNYLYALNGEGQLKWQYNAEGKIYSLFVADLDNDGVQEILVSSDAKDLFALTPDLQKKWSVKLENRVLSIFAIDLNNDGRLEVLAGSEDKHLYVFRDDGELLWKYDVGARVFSVYAIDVDRDGLLEVFVGSEDSVHVLRIELNGSELEKILNCHTLLGQPPSSHLNLSPTESALLQVLTTGNSFNTQHYTLQQLENANRNGDHLLVLSLLLALEQQHAQLLWCRSIGYVRTLALGHILDDEKFEITVGTSQGDVYALDVYGNLGGMLSNGHQSSRIGSLTSLLLLLLARTILN